MFIVIYKALINASLLSNMYVISLPSELVVAKCFHKAWVYISKKKKKQNHRIAGKLNYITKHRERKQFIVRCSYERCIVLQFGHQIVFVYNFIISSFINMVLYVEILF
jgi:hypothetical protein